ncbi:MAG: hypothetical protein INR66_26455 [Gordonia polyisoprenivorans]|nr:hypothetical protein [Gordonia polyisoprenivorans]
MMLAIFAVCMAVVVALVIAARIDDRRDRRLGITRCTGCDTVVAQPGFCSRECHEQYLGDTAV